MIKRCILQLLLFISFLQIGNSQVFFQTSSLFTKTESDKSSGSLNIIQDPGVDTLISRYVMANKNLKSSTGNNGMWGFRIQIFRSGERNAQEESNKVNAEFMLEFPDIRSYPVFQRPNWFLVRAGDFRTKVDGTKQLFLVRRKFPNAYLVQDVINFPDLNNN
jgi:hypothetical protein